MATPEPRRLRRTWPVHLGLAFALVVAFASRSTARAEDDSTVVLPKWKAGEHAGTVAIDGKEEAFTALVPKGYSPKKPVAVVLLAHGNGGKAQSFLHAIKPSLGKKPPLIVSLERCDNTQDAVGYVPKYLDALMKQFAIDPELVFALGFSGGGFRLWDDVVCKAEALPRFRAVVLVGAAKQSFDPPDKPERAPTVHFVGDPKDPNCKTTDEAAQLLEAKGYEVLRHPHASGHSLPVKEMKSVFAWIDEAIADELAARKKR